MDTTLIFASALVVVCVIYATYQIRGKGFKGAIFGGKILRTLGEIELVDEGMIGGTIVVYEIEHKRHNTILGIEIRQSTGIVAMSFHADDVMNLIDALNKFKN